MAYTSAHGPPLFDATHAWDPASGTSPPPINNTNTSPPVFPRIAIDKCTGWRSLPDREDRRAPCTVGVGEVKYPARETGKTLVYECRIEALARADLLATQNAVLQGFADTDEGVMTEAQIQIAAAIPGQGMTAYENGRLFSQVRTMATVDGLTGLYNRNHFFGEADRLLTIAQRQRRPISAIMMDIDHFKTINDTYGHPVGDEVIRVVAQRLRDVLGEGEVLGRYGGEEFAVVTPQTAMPAVELAGRLHLAVSGHPVPTDAGLLPVTISVGVARAPGAEMAASGDLVARADEAMYAAKRSGRNRVCSAEGGQTDGGAQTDGGGQPEE